MSDLNTVDPFREFLFSIYCQLAINELRYIMLLASFTEREKETVDLDGKNNSFEIFIILKQRMFISEQNLGELKRILRNLNRKDLEKKVREYESSSMFPSSYVYINV
jgi:hypothetical protein